MAHKPDEARVWESLTAARPQAAVCEAAGDTELGSMLRRRQSNSMRKSHLIALCRFWGYRSDLWQRKTDLVRKRKFAAAGAPPQAAAGALTVALPRPPATAAAPTDDAGLRTLVVEQLGSLLAKSTRSIAGDAARAAVQAHNEVAFYAICLSEYETMATALRTTARSWRVTLKQQRAWSIAAAAAAASRSHFGERGNTLWALTPFLNADAPVESSLAVMQSGLVVAHRMWRAGMEHETAVHAPNPLSPAVSVALAEFEHALLDALQFKAQASMLLARLRAEAPLRSYFFAVELLGAECVRYCTNAASAYDERAAWTAELMRNGLAGRTLAQDRRTNNFMLANIDKSVTEIRRMAETIADADE